MCDRRKGGKGVLLIIEEEISALLQRKKRTGPDRSAGREREKPDPYAAVFSRTGSEKEKKGEKS